MPDDLTPAAEAFLRQWCRELDSEDRAEFREELAALLAEVRGEEREACAADAERMAAHLGLNERTSVGALAVAASLRAKGTAAVCPAPPRWIPTAEALPAERACVLVWWKGDGSDYSRIAYRECCPKGWLSGWEWRTDDGNYYPRQWVTHWQPLPPGPPEEGEEP